MTYPTQYDDMIRNAMATHFPQVDWRQGKAQLIAESNLDPNARSGAGAQGLAQFVLDTWDEDVCQHFGWDADTCSARDPVYAIPAFAWYMARLWDEWKAPRTPFDRLRLAQASYNAGIGNIIHAQRIARAGMLSPPNDYDSIIAALPQVTGLKSQETITYVTRIAAIYEQLASGVTA